VISRPHLEERLTHGLQRKLTLVSAPAGFGKTTLLCEWVAARDQPTAWLSLDETDKDPIRFWTYVAAALDSVYPGIGSIALAVDDRMLRLAGHEPLLVPLINRIAAESVSVVLVLDDYHLIRSSHIQDGLTYLIQNQPPNLHLILATRADPPLPLARLRAQGQLHEIRQADLQFTPDETQNFFAGVLAEPLSPEHIALLTRRTEGWPVGIRLASISLSEETDPSSFVRAFTGTDRHIVEYLVQEVLSSQTESLQRFLLQTSILDQMSGPLCAAVTGQADSSTLLQQMEQANLFLVALDRERQWFRYHRLFADLLQSRLRRQHSQVVPLLHRRASDWFQLHGHPGFAITHALAAGDSERAADLVAAAAESVLMRSEAFSLLRWIDALPDHVVSARPLLCAYHAAAMLPTGQSHALVEQRLRQAEKPAGAEPSSEAIALRGVLAGLSGDLETSIALSRRALELLPQDSLYFRGISVDNLGVTYFLQGDFQGAIRSLTEAVELAQSGGRALTGVGSLCRLAGLHMTTGHLREAAELYEQALELARDEDGRDYPIAGKALVGLGEILREWNDLDRATDVLKRGIELISLIGEVGAIVGHISLAFIEQSRNRPAQAREHMFEAQQIAERFDASELDDRMVAACAARLDLAQGDLESAMQWAKKWNVIPREHLTKEGTPAVASGVMADLQQLERTVLARLYLAEGDLQPALRLLRSAVINASQQGRGRRHIEALLLQALTLQTMGQPDDALESLVEALTLAQPEGHVRVFADEGAALRPLLLGIIESGAAVDYSSTLLAVIDRETGSASPPTRAASLPEPLTGRETEVLRWLATHLSSTEIADQLLVSPNTARFHIKNIYGKLGAHSRNEAMTRARELGLI